jgi:hypothetical protein
MTVSYSIDGIMDPENPSALLQKEKSINLSDILSEMKAGVRYSLILEFKDKSLSLTIKPLDWIMDYADFDYSSSTILANSNQDNEGVLWLYYLDENNYWKAGPRNREITMSGGKNIQGRFYILAPTSGQWQITTYPAEAAQYFKVEPSSGAIEDLVDNEGHFTGYVEFLIKPNGIVPTQQVLHFNVDIMINGQWRNANTEFNRKDWHLYREVE